MTLGTVDLLVGALNAARVRYLIAGGLAVNAHGYLRFTQDVDVVLQLAPANIDAAFAALAGLGYRPNVPVSAAGLADQATLNFWSDAHPATPIDVFVTEPFDFDGEYARALVKPLGAVAVRFVSIPTLIRMKETAGRPHDKIDIEFLRKLADAAD